MFLLLLLGLAGTVCVSSTDIACSSSTGWGCPTNYVCGAGNICYRITESGDDETTEATAAANSTKIGTTAMAFVPTYFPTDACKPSAIEVPCGCFCKVNQIVYQCTSIQDCDPILGCVCRTPDCQCGNEYCDDAGLCDESVHKCKCGGKYGAVCKDDEICHNGECFCNPDGFLTCKEPLKCKNGECICGKRACQAHETCITTIPNKPFCACGDFPRQCNEYEDCMYDGFNYTCICGNKECNLGEFCYQGRCTDNCTSPDVTCVDQDEGCTGMTEVCYEPLYLELMTERCGRTCKLCPELCADETPECEGMVDRCSDTGSRQFMGENCAKTCGFCYGSESETKLTTTPPMLTTTFHMTTTTHLVTKTPSATCLDKDELCPTVIEFCYDIDYISFMSDLCPLTCNSCPELCGDENSACAASVNYCTDAEPEIRKYMWENCAKTCHFC